MSSSLACVMRRKQTLKSSPSWNIGVLSGTAGRGLRSRRQRGGERLSGSSWLQTEQKDCRPVEARTRLRHSVQ
eukprot:1043345-Pleurochrysis_carterae.AAC.1